jgi:histone H3/H4
MTTAPSAATGGGSSAKSTSTKSAAKTVTKAGTTTKKKIVVRKVKKPAGTSAAQHAFAASRAAQMDLATLRNDAAARKIDPLWYRAEDVLPSIADDTLMSESATKVLPEQIQIVEAALGKNNLNRSDVTPQAFACLLEQARRYAMEILTDSQDYAFVAGRTEIAAADLALANEFRPDHAMAVSTQVPKLNLLSQNINRYGRV